MVIAIIVMTATFAVVGIPGMIRSGEKTEALAKLDSALTIANAESSMYRTPVAIRIERSYRTDQDGIMLKDTSGNAIWGDHQQIKLAILGHRRKNPVTGHSNFPIAKFGTEISEEFTFRRLSNSSTIELPKTFWLAPGEEVDDVLWQPNHPEVSKISPFDTFYVIFNHKSELRQRTDWLYYMDETQLYDSDWKRPIIDHPEPSSMSIKLYDRTQYNSGKLEFENINITHQGDVIYN